MDYCFVRFLIEERLADSKRRDRLRVCDNYEKVNKTVLVERYSKMCSTKDNSNRGD